MACSSSLTLGSSKSSARLMLLIFPLSLIRQLTGVLLLLKLPPTFKSASEAEVTK